MSDNRYNHYQNTAKGHVAITPSDTVNLPTLSTVVVITTGNFVVVDQYDVAITYTGMPAGYVFPVSVKRINATNTTGSAAMLRS